MVEHFRVLREARVIAVVGASRNPAKDAHSVPAYLKERGYRIVPVNPTADEILGEKAYPSLLDLPDDIVRELDVVNVFRPPEEADSIVDQVAELRRRHGRPWAIWFQLGTSTRSAVEKARSMGLIVVDNKCMRVEHRRMQSS